VTQDSQGSLLGAMKCVDQEPNTDGESKCPGSIDVSLGKYW